MNSNDKPTSQKAKFAQSITRQSAKKTSTVRSPRADKADDKADEESAVLAAIAAMPEPYNAMGERLHHIIRTSAPGLSPRLWYRMPDYARDDKVICFFRGGDKLKERYMTLGFNEEANLDEGRMWPIAFALKELTKAEEASISALVKKAVS